jgi:acetylornithine/succinyldiaminopimelate/putrescine aminotransferase
LVEQALAEGVLFNATQDTVLRFLPPFLLEEKHVDKGIRVLKKLLGKKRKKSTVETGLAPSPAVLAN